MKKISAFAFVISLLLTLEAFSQVPNTCYQTDTAIGSVYHDHNVDMLKLKLEVSFEPAAGKVTGRVTHYFTPLRPSVDTLYLDAPAITIKSCKLNGTEVKYIQRKSGICLQFSPALTWDKSDSVSIEYSATPRKGLYFIGWQDPSNRSHKQLWTQGEGEDNRYWIPSYDNPNDKLITETIITFDKDYNVLSNGLLLNGKKTTQPNMPEAIPPVNADGKTRTWHYKMSKPHSSYLIMLAIGKYSVKNFSSSSGVKMANWYYPEWEDRYQPTFKNTAASMDFLEKETGIKYPWDCFANVMVQDFIYGAMENTSAVIFGDFFSADARSFNDGNYMSVNCHEMTHQWFGDLITCKAWNDGWLHESFATYYPQLFFKQLYGEDTYEWSIRQSQNVAIEASKKDRNPIRNSGSGTSRVYQKGSVVIDMLRNVIGDEAYRKSITYYLTQNGYKNVAVNNFEDAFKDAIGANLDWFFNEWIYRGGEPAYSVTYLSTINNNETVTRFAVSQTQQINDVIGLFKMPIDFEVYYTDGTKDAARKMVSKLNDTIYISNPKNKKISFVLFDAGNHVLKTVTFKKTTPELLAQLAVAPQMIDRYDALIALREIPIDEKRNALIESYKKEKFQAMRAEVVAQLASAVSTSASADALPTHSYDKNSSSVEILTQSFSDKDVNVRMSAVGNLNPSDNDFKKYFEKALEDSSYNVVVTSLKKLVEQNSTDAEKYLQSTSTVWGVGNRVRIKWLELAAQYIPQKKQQYLDELIDMTSSGFEFRTRIGAAASLKTLKYLNEKLIGYLFDTQLSPNGRLAGGCKPTLEFFYQQADDKKMIQDYYSSHTWTEEQKKVLEAYSK